MKTKKTMPTITQPTVWIVLLILAGAATVGAQTGGSYGLSSNIIDGGGGTSSGGQYIVRALSVHMVSAVKNKHFLKGVGK